MEAAPFGKINWVNPILPDRTDRSRSLFNLQLSAGHHQKKHENTKDEKPKKDALTLSLFRAF